MLWVLAPTFHDFSPKPSLLVQHLVHCKKIITLTQRVIWHNQVLHQTSLAGIWLLPYIWLSVRAKHVYWWTYWQSIIVVVEVQHSNYIKMNQRTWYSQNDEKCLWSIWYKDIHLREFEPSPPEPKSAVCDGFMSAGHDVVFVLGQWSNQTCYYNETQRPDDAKIPPRAEEHRRDYNGQHRESSVFLSVQLVDHFTPSHPGSTLEHAGQTSATFSTN